MRQNVTTWPSLFTVCCQTLQFVQLNRWRTLKNPNLKDAKHILYRSPLCIISLTGTSTRSPVDPMTLFLLRSRNGKRRGRVDVFVTGNRWTKQWMWRDIIFFEPAHNTPYLILVLLMRPIHPVIAIICKYLQLRTSKGQIPFLANIQQARTMWHRTHELSILAKY